MNFDPISFAMGMNAAKGSGGSSGGGTLPAGTYYEPMYLKKATTYPEVWAMLNGERYAFTNASSSNGSLANVYKFDDAANTATQLVSNTSTALGMYNAYAYQYIEFNGKIHIIGGEETKHYVFDGTNLTAYSAIPNKILTKSAFIQDGKLKACSSYNTVVYVWDETTDTWTEEANLFNSRSFVYMFNLNNGVYAVNSTKLYKYDGGALTNVHTFSKQPSYIRGAYGDCIYYQVSGTAGIEEHKFNVVTNEDKIIGACPFDNNAQSLARIWEYQGKLAIQSSYYGGDSIVSFYIHEIE